MALPIRDRLPEGVESNRRNYWNMANVLTLVGMGGAFTAVAIAGAMQVGAAQEKITQLEKTQNQDRETFNRGMSKIEHKVDGLDDKANTIMQTLERIEGQRDGEQARNKRGNELRRP